MDTVFFWLSKLVWMLISPASLLVLLILIAWLLLLKQRYRAAKVGLTIVAVMVLIISLFPVGQWLLMPLEQRFTTNPTLPENIDGIVVLSGSENAVSSYHWQQVQLNSAAERGVAFMALARQYPNAKLVFTGGTGSLINQQYKEAAVAKQMYEQLGMDTSKIQFETQSRNTAENASFSFQMINPKAGENWLLVTTAWHMPRSVGLFCQVGWQMIPYPVDHRTLPGQWFQLQWSFADNLLELNIAAKEWLGLLAYYFSGKTSTLLPQSCVSPPKT